MHTPPVNAHALGKSGMECLQRGYARGARAAFEQIINQGQADASICMMPACVCLSMKDRVSSFDAVEQAPALEPHNLRALIMKADYLDEIGDTRAPASFYLAAITVVAVIDTLPADLRDQIAHAQMMSNRYAAQFRRFPREQMVKRGLDGGASSNRFRQSLDILIGRKKRCVQEPRYYFFPKLPQGQFYDRNDFSWLGMLEAQTVAIRAELFEVMQTRCAFKPYVQSALNRPNQNQQGMLSNPDWGAVYLWQYGDIVAQNVARYPHSMRALADGPLTKVAGRPPSVLFSLLQPGASIRPHHGFLNTHLICRLPLIVPDGCGFKVSNDVRSWVEGAPGCSMTPLNTKPETTAWWYG